MPVYVERGDLEDASLDTPGRQPLRSTLQAVIFDLNLELDAPAAQPQTIEPAERARLCRILGDLCRCSLCAQRAADMQAKDTHMQAPQNAGQKPDTVTLPGPLHASVSVPTQRRFSVASLAEHLERVEQCSCVRMVPAKVALARFKFDDLDVDVSLDTPDRQPLRNTALLKAYSQLHEDVVRLALAIKGWAKRTGVQGAQHGHLSSYCLRSWTSPPAWEWAILKILLRNPYYIPSLRPRPKTPRYP